MDQGNEFVGISLAKDSHKEFLNGNTPSYYIELDIYIVLKPPIEWDDFRKKYEKKLKDIYDNYNNYNNMTLFYNINLKLNEGGYLTEVPSEFVELLNEYYNKISGTSLPHYNESEETNTNGKAIEKNMVINNLPKNIILHGPVGTGKTYFANIIAKKIVNNEINRLDDIEKIINSSEPINLDKEDPKLEEEKRIVKVTFHKSYSYEDFIIGIKAETKDGKILYTVKPGRFKQLCDKAKNDINNNYVLIIDEINRGDISRIFGELITLIEEDKRGEKNKITLPYNKENSDEPEELIVPENLYIIGTMNDSDKSISLVDIAIRRRFTFIFVGFNENILRNWLNGIREQETIIGFIKDVNERISAYKESLDFQIGHAFFRSLKEYNDSDKEKEVLNIFKNKIFPLLEEYFYNDMDVLVEKILNNKFYERKEIKLKDQPYYYFVINKKSFENFDNFLKELIENKNSENESFGMEKENES
jgi:5-methylcytosine-specific restriction protein B